MQQEEISFKEFSEKFKTEDDCREHFFKIKWPEGFVCPKCGYKEYSFIRYRNLYQCSSCGHQASLTAGTIMHKSHTKLRGWFMAIFLVAHDKRGISAKQLSKDIGVSYFTSWLLLHKLREAMAQRDSAYFLRGIIEMDDAFFGAPTEGGKRGRGTEKTPAIIALELDKQGCPKFIKIEAVESVDGKTISEMASRTIVTGSEIHTDGLNSYEKLSEAGYGHESKIFSPENNPDHLHWLHTVISNLKALIGGTYHGLDKKHLQRYFDEFCYRFNRRKFEGQIFGRLLHACIKANTITYKQLVAANTSETI
jgi:transposase-like protein/DNA-directed RNA polymerase subunit RPC12/RpoP